MLYAVAKNIGITDNSAQQTGYLKNLMQRALVTPSPQLAAGLVPPTNQWFSSLVFSPLHSSQPVYAWPLSLKPTVTGFQLSQPVISSAANTINAPFVNQLEVIGNDLASSKVIGYDDLSVQFKQTGQDGKFTSVRLIRGSPFVFMTLSPNQTVKINTGGGTVAVRKSNEVIIQSRGSSFGLHANDGITITENKELINIKANDKGGNLTLISLPTGGNIDPYFEAAANQITSTEVKNNIKDNQLITSYVLKTTTGGDTLFGVLPYAKTGGDNANTYGSFNTLEGIQAIKKGLLFTNSIDLVQPQKQLDISKLPEPQKTELKGYLLEESKSLGFTKNDTYFGGKELYRAAQLLMLAKQLDYQQASEIIQPKLKAELGLWFDPKGYEKRSDKYFYYDNVLKGLVGVKASFGSEEFNDHQFHYGYFIDAAAILSQYDSVFLSQHREFIQLIIKDISNLDRNNKNFPYMRAFDQYSGHSWASGFGKFDAGQNQESSSEAVHSWEAVNRWAKVSGNDNLASMALSAYNREVYAANRNWLSVDKSQVGFENYQHSIVPLVWSGKLDYATFFDSSAEAKLAIQLIPLSPGSNYLADKLQVANNLSAMYKETNLLQPQKFKDILIMYESLADPLSAKEKLKSIKPDDIDGALSKSYLYAYIYTR